MSQAYDVIVLGLGGMGSATVYQLARRGARVLGLEQFEPAHAHGSSHGHTRIIRTAYYEHPDYIPLVRRAFGQWRDLEQTLNRSLLIPCDCLSLGLAGGELIVGVDRAASRLAPGAVAPLSSADVRKAYPFRLGDDYVGRLEHEAGILLVEDCVRGHVEAARRAGADLHFSEPVREWRADGQTLEVSTSQDHYSTKVLVVTAGAWATGFLRDAGLPLTVMRQTMQWFRPGDLSRFHPDRFPIFLLDGPNGAFYGVPMIDERGFKIARHYGVEELLGPERVDWTIQTADVEPVADFLRTYLPDANATFVEGQVCMYTLTPDRHFIIDRHPGHSNVVIAAGFSGHGFKFAPVVGEALADLALNGQTDLPIGMFSSKRFPRDYS